MGALLLIWAAMVAAGDTPIGRLLHAAFVERPASWCARVRRGHVALAVLLVTIAAAAMWAGGTDAISVLGMATPDLAIWLTSFEIATYLDMAVTVVLVASTLRGRIVAARLGTAVAHFTRSAGRRRRVRSQARRSDPEPDGLSVSFA